MRKKILLLITTACLSIGGMLSFALLSRKSESSKLSADNSATFMMDFTSRVEIDENVAEYKMRKEGSTATSVTVRTVGANAIAGGIGSSNEFYFYNTQAFRGISATAIQFSASTSYYVTSYLSYNPLNLADIYAGKYQDLFCWMGTKYGSDMLSINSDDMPSLVNYRYVLCHIVPLYEQDVNVTMLGVMTPCASEPETVPIGTNAGVLPEYTKTFLSTTSGGCTTIPNQVGNGAYFVNPSASYFNFMNAVAHDAENPFVNSLVTGFDKTYETEIYGQSSDIYQRKDSDKTHTFIVTKTANTYGDIYSISYDDSMEYIIHSTTWPTDKINETIPAKYQSLVIPFTDSLIIDYATTVSTDYDFDYSVMVIVTLSEGHTVADVKTKLNEIRQGYVNKGMTLEDDIDNEDYYGYRLFYDLEFFGITVSADQGSNQINILIGYNESKAFPTRTDIASKLNLTSHTDKIALFSGSGRFSWGNERGGAMPYGATAMSVRGYETSTSDVNSFFEALVAAGYKLKNSNESSDEIYRSYKCELGDMFGSYLVINITHRPSTNYTYFGYYYYNLENYAYEVSSYQEMMNMINFQEDSPFVSEAILPSEATYKYMNTYMEESISKGFVYGAGEEFVNSLTSIDGVIYDYISDSYRFAGSSSALKIEQFEGVVVLSRVYREYFNYNLQSYTGFNDAIDSFINNCGLDTSNVVHIDESDNIPAYFFIGSESKIQYIGTEEKVDELKTLLSNKLASNTHFTYSEYLDAYINEEGATYSFKKELKPSDHIYSLDITLTTGTTYKDYDSYTNLELGSKTLLSKYPDIISDKSLKAFVIETDSEYNLSLYTNQDFIPYTETLLDNNFVEIVNQGYMYVDPTTGESYAFSLSVLSDHKQRITFSKGGQFFDSSFLDEEGREVMKEFFTKFDVPSYFTSTSKIYIYSADPTQGYLTVFNSSLEVDNYLDHLLDDGYELNESNGYYMKSSSDGNTFYGVKFVDYGGATQIQFNYMEMNFGSYEDMQTELKKNSRYDINSEHLVYPVDDEQNHFAVVNNSDKDIGICLNKAYDISAYDAAIMSFAEYQRKETGKISGMSYTRYILQYGTITIFEYLGLYYQVQLYCSYKDPAGRDFDHAIAVSMGDNSILIDDELKYYVITIPEDGWYSFETSGDSKVDTVGTLYNSDGVQIAYNDDDTSKKDNNHFYLEFEFNEGDLIYIGVRSFSSIESEVTLRISTVEKFDPADATPITRGVTNLPLTKEEQYFSYTPTLSGNYYFNFTGDYSVTIIIYDDSMNQIDSSYGTDSYNRYLEADTTYIIGLRLYDEEKTSSATIALELDADLPGDDSTPVEMGDTDFLVNQISKVWFVFTPEESGSYTITTVGELDTYGWLYSEYGLETNDDSGEGNNFMFECVYLEEGITYYIGVILWDNGDSDPTLQEYVLRITPYVEPEPIEI